MRLSIILHTNRSMNWTRMLYRLKSNNIQYKTKLKFIAVSEFLWLRQVLQMDNHNNSILRGSGGRHRLCHRRCGAAWERKLIPLWEKSTLTDSMAEAGCNFAAVAPPTHPTPATSPSKASEGSRGSAAEEKHLRWVSVKLFYCLPYKLRLLAG